MALTEHLTVIRQGFAVSAVLDENSWRCTAYVTIGGRKQWLVAATRPPNPQPHCHDGPLERAIPLLHGGEWAEVQQVNRIKGLPDFVDQAVGTFATRSAPSREETPNGVVDPPKLRSRDIVDEWVAKARPMEMSKAENFEVLLELPGDMVVRSRCELMDVLPQEMWLLA